MSGEEKEKGEIHPAKFIENRVATAYSNLAANKFSAKYATESNEYVNFHAGFRILRLMN